MGVSGSYRENIIVSGFYDGYLKIFQSGLTETIFQYKAHKSSVNSIALHDSESSLYAVTTSKDTVALLWKIDVEDKSCKLVAKMVGAKDSPQTAVISPTGRRSAIGGWDHQIHIFDIYKIVVKDNGSKHWEPKQNSLIAQTATAEGHTESVTALTWPSEENIFSGSMDRSLRKWDLAVSVTPICINTLIAAHPITCISSNSGYNA